MIFIKKYQSVVSNQNRTLKKSVNVTELISKLSDKTLIEKLTKFESIEEVYLWDVGKKATTHLKKGAILVIVVKDYLYIGHILDIIHDQDGTIGDAVRWNRQFKAPWQNVIVLADLEWCPNADNNEILNFILDHDKYPYRTTRDFFVLQGEEEQKFLHLLKEESLLPKANSSGSLVVPKIVEKKELNLPEWLNKLISNINKLKQDPRHQEREHESLVERFFENLGYERHNEIKFQRGRVDILISTANSPLIVIEVKRHWTLNINRDKDAIQQAYRYALENGARFIIITNGDYFALFDRDKGRSYSEHLLKEFRLSNLNEKSMETINFLKKDKLTKL